MKRTLFSLLVLLMTLVAHAQDLPQVTLRDLSGKPVATSSFLQSGKPIILSFFGTWCKPCLRELDAISEVYPEWQAETGVTLYAICINEGADVQKIRPTVHAHDWDYVVLSDANGELKRAMRVSVRYLCLMVLESYFTVRRDMSKVAKESLSVSCVKLPHQPLLNNSP